MTVAMKLSHIFPIDKMSALEFGGLAGRGWKRSFTPGMELAWRNSVQMQKKI